MGKYDWGEWEGEIPDVHEKMRRLGFLDVSSAEVNR